MYYCASHTCVPVLWKLPTFNLGWSANLEPLLLCNSCCSQKWTYFPKHFLFWIWKGCFAFNLTCVLYLEYTAIYRKNNQRIHLTGSGKSKQVLLVPVSKYFGFLELSLDPICPIWIDIEIRRKSFNHPFNFSTALCIVFNKIKFSFLTVRLRDEDN